MSSRPLGDCANHAIKLLDAKERGVPPHLRPQVPAATMMLEGTGLCRDCARDELRRPTSPNISFGAPVPNEQPEG